MNLKSSNILRIAPGETTAKEWIKPGTGGLNSVLGVFADERDKALWVCSNKMGQTGEATALMKFDLRNGKPKGKYPLPGEAPLCNDIAVVADGTAYITDRRQAKINSLRNKL